MFELYGSNAAGLQCPRLGVRASEEIPALIASIGAAYVADMGTYERAHSDFQPDAAATERAERSGCPAGREPVMACRRTVSSGAVAVRLAAPAAAPLSSWRQAEPLLGDAALRTAAREVPDTRHAAASPHCPRSNAPPRTRRWKAGNLDGGIRQSCLAEGVEVSDGRCSMAGPCSSASDDELRLAAGGVSRCSGAPNALRAHVPLQRSAAVGQARCRDAPLALHVAQQVVGLDEAAALAVHGIERPP